MSTKAKCICVEKEVEVGKAFKKMSTKAECICVETEVDGG